MALTGGIGAGKSEALAAFGRHGAATCSSDEIVHRLLREDGRVQRAVVERFGPDVLGPDGSVDRGAIAGVVFAEPTELSWLEGTLHPLVRAEYEAWRDALAGRSEPPALCVVEVPLLYETGAESRFDRVVAITAPPEVRSARSRVTPDRRAQRLLPDEEKVRRADFSYVNTGTLADLDAFVGGVVAELVAA